MNFLNMQYFLTTAEERNITRAAERLYISQQALSAHIAALEKEFGTELFRRQPSFSLTYAGSCLADACKRMLETRRELNMQMREIAGELRDELKIGISYTRGQALLPYLLPSFGLTHPLIEITLQEGSAVALAELLQRGKIDLLVSPDPRLPSIANAIELAEERLLLVVPARRMEERFGSRADAMRAEFAQGVSLGSFAGEPFILLKHGDTVRTALDEAFYREGITPRIRLETENIQTAFSLACLGMGLTVYPEMFLMSEYTLPGRGGSKAIDCFPIRNMPAEKLYVACSRMRRLSRAASEFIGELQEKLSCGLLLPRQAAGEETRMPGIF